MTAVFNIDAIGEVKNNAAPGTDCFPATLLKKCADELSEPLYILWRHSLDNGDIAPMLKTAVICPILKQGSQRNHPKSYRPVSLTLCFMFYVLCFMFYVLCFMFYVLCFMFYLLCFVFC